MNSPMSTSSTRSVRFSTKGYHASTAVDGQPTATASQEKLAGFEQERLKNAFVHVVGAGGIGTSLLDNAVRKGVGHAYVYDGDVVEQGNLGRQRFFPQDVGQNKAICAARNALPHASWPTELVAYPEWFQDAVRHGCVTQASAAIVGPDNDEVRVFAARYFYKVCPVIFVGIGTQAEHGYVFVQRPPGPCFGCLFPDAVSNKRRPCPGTPAMIDILLATASLALTALDSILMKGRPIQWNYWDIYPNGMVPTQPLKIERRKDCAVCGKFE